LPRSCWPSRRPVARSTSSRTKLDRSPTGADLAALSRNDRPPHPGPWGSSPGWVAHGPVRLRSGRAQSEVPGRFGLKGSGFEGKGGRRDGPRSS
jgi:hypothetical protein